MKVALMLQELQLPFALDVVDIFKGQQHSADFVAINPNGKVPVLDDDGVIVFDSHAILLHLALKEGKLLPQDKTARAAALSWLQFVATGLSPFSGQAVHFLHYAPEPVPYARNRYLKEVERHYAVLDAHLAGNRYLAGEHYSIADIALWGWARAAAYIFGEGGLNAYPNVKRLVEEISVRPAAGRVAAMVAQLDLNTDMTDEARRALFPQNA
jgi:GSH-dependent disulfide-bond oxidoreductase